MGTRKRYQTLLLATLPRHARHTVLHTQLLQHIRAYNRASKTHSEKPKSTQYSRYKNYRMLLRLRYWRMTHQVNSLMQAYYSRKPRNPE